MKRKLAVLLAAVAAVVGLSVSSGNALQASKGPNQFGVTTVTLSPEDLQLTAWTYTNKLVDYPDGAHMVQATFKWENTAGATWDVNSYSIWNVPYSSGGHTDTLVDSCKFLYVSENQCTGGAGDGGTRVDFGQDNMWDTDTFNIRVWVDYGSTTYCRRIYINKNGSTSWTYCP